MAKAKNRKFDEQINGKWIVKKYANRKFYDYMLKRFSTLADVAVSLTQRPIAVYDRYNRDITIRIMADIHADALKRADLGEPHRATLTRALEYPGGLLSYARFLETVNANVVNTLKGGQ